MDLTTHIHWDELKEMFSMQGMSAVWHKKQSEFLLAAGILEQLTSHQDTNPFLKRKNKIEQFVL